MKIKSLLIIAVVTILVSCTQTVTLIPPAETAISTETNTPTVTVTPTVDIFEAHQIAQATLYATRFPIPTAPSMYPTPLPPRNSRPDDIVMYTGTTQIVGNYILRSWEHAGFTRVITLSSIGRKQIGIEDAQVWIDKMTGTDLTGDGYPEAVFRTHNGANGSGGICEYITIISLAREPTMVLQQAPTCGYKPNVELLELVDFFVDTNNDGRIEFIAFQPKWDGLAHHYDYSIKFMRTWEYNPTTDCFEMTEKGLSSEEYAEMILKLSQWPH